MNHPGNGEDYRAELLALADELLKRCRPGRRRPVVPLTLGMREKLHGQSVRQQDPYTRRWFCGDCLEDLPPLLADQNGHVCAPGTEPAPPLPPVEHEHTPRDRGMHKDGENAHCWRCGQLYVVKWVPVTTPEEALNAYGPSSIRIGFAPRCGLCGIAITTSHYLTCAVWSPLDEELDDTET